MNFLIVYLFTAEVKNVEVISVSDTSVRFLWNNIEVSELQGYQVFYSRIGGSGQEIVNASDNEIEILDLESNSQYIFQVVPIFLQDGEVFMGVKSAVAVVETNTIPNRKLVLNLSGCMNKPYCTVATTK